MSDDMLIGVGVKADFASLKSEAKASADALRQAQANWKQAFEELGLAAEQGSTQAVAALKQYENELNQAQARATAASQALSSVGSSASHAVPQFAAASGALRTLEGHFTNNIRAAERFLTTTLGLGPALQAAFPIVGGVALLGVFYELGKEAVKFGNNAALLARETGTGWLDGAIGQMDGLKESTKQTDDEMQTLRRDMDSLNKQGREDAIETIRLTQGEAAAIRAKAKDQRDYAEAQAKILTPINQERAAIEKQLEAAKIKRSSVTGGEVSMADDNGFMSLSQIVQARQRLEQLDAQAQTVAGHIAEANKKASNLSIEASKAQEEQDKKTAEEGSRAAEKAARERGRLVSMMVKENEDAAKEQQRITEEVQAFGTRQLKEEEQEQHRADEAERNRARDAKQAFEDKMRAEERDAEAARENADAQIEAAAKVAEAQIDYQLATGAISLQEAAHAKATIEAQKYTAQIAALQDELRELRRIQREGGDTSDKQAQLGNKVTSLSGDRDAALVKGAGVEAREYTRLWQAALRDVGRQFTQVEDAMLRGQISFSQGMKRMTAEVALDGVHWAQRWLAQHFLANSMKLASTTATNAATVASDASAAAASTAITRTHALQQAFIHAKLAAVKAFDWGSSWGGPIVGAIMAAGAFTGAMAWAMFEQGGVAKATGPAYLHAGERVLTARQTATFDRVMSGGGSVTNSRSSSLNLHYNPILHGAGNTKEMQRTIRQSPRDIAKAAKRALRNGSLSLG